MSAYVVCKTHIDALLTEGLRVPSRRVSWFTKDEWHELTYQNADEIGTMLLAANEASVAHRYREEPNPVEYTFTASRKSFSAVEMLLAVRGFEYQSCERPDWSDSEAYAFCQALSAHVTRRLPGMSEAETWHITPDTKTEEERRIEAYRAARAAVAQ